MKKIEGIIHIHSTYSYDGLHSPEEITRYAMKQGYRFIGMSEHSNTLNGEMMERLVAECHALSGPDCLVIPGIEFTCEGNLHIVGLGVESFSFKRDPVAIAKFIREHGGISIVAHPIRYDYRIPSKLIPVVDGIEVWNRSYDGRFVPNDRSLELLKSLRRYNPKLTAFGAAELHRISHHLQVSTTLSCRELNQEQIFQALKESHCLIGNGKPYFVLDSKKELHWIQLVRIRWMRRFFLFAKEIRNTLSKGMFWTSWAHKIRAYFQR